MSPAERRINRAPGQWFRGGGRMRTVLLTGFGPFPGAQFNPTQALVRDLARLRRPNLRVVPHIFCTSYAAVDRELPALVAKYKPDALLMFGLHGRARTIRIETLARNARSRVRDVDGTVAASRAIARGEAARFPLPSPARRLWLAARKVQVRAEISNNAGGYLCNYLCWRAGEAARRTDGPRICAFVHVPLTSRNVRPRGPARHRIGQSELTRAGAAILAALAGCLAYAGKRP